MSIIYMKFIFACNLNIICQMLILKKLIQIIYFCMFFAYEMLNLTFLHYYMDNLDKNKAFRQYGFLYVLPNEVYVLKSLDNMDIDIDLHQALMVQSERKYIHVINAAHRKKVGF